MASNLTHNDIQDGDKLVFNGFVSSKKISYGVLKTKCDKKIGPQKDKSFKLRYKNPNNKADEQSYVAWISVAFLDELFQLDRISVKRGGEWLYKVPKPKKAKAASSEEPKE